jgi:hypothetical protein
MRERAVPDSDDLGELPELIRRMEALLGRLDMLEVYDAGAYLSMAVHALGLKLEDSPAAGSTASGEPDNR